MRPPDTEVSPINIPLGGGHEERSDRLPYRVCLISLPRRRGEEMSTRRPKGPENALLGIDASEVISRLVVSASLPFRQPHSAPHVRVTGGGAAQMDHGGQCLFSFKSCESRLLML